MQSRTIVLNPFVSTDHLVPKIILARTIENQQFTNHSIVSKSSSLSYYNY